MNVAVADVDVAAAESVVGELRAQGRRAVAFECDVSQAESVNRLAENSLSEFGEVTVLCSNAGIMVARPLLECPAEDWERLFAVNLFGAVRCVQAFVPHMRMLSHRSHILITASPMAFIGGPRDRFAGSASGSSVSAYSASKSALVDYSEQLSTAVRPLGIGVSVLCPGVTRTSILEGPRLPRDPDAPRVTAAPEELRAIVAHGADPQLVAEIACEAVAENRFYIFTDHSPLAPALERFAGVVEDFALVKGPGTS